MKYLITGGCGFVGSNLALEVLSKKEDLIIFDNLFRFGSSQNLKWLQFQAKNKFQFIHGDIRNNNDVEKVVREEKPDIIFHLAGQVSMLNSINNPRLDFEVNTYGTFNLLETVRMYSPKSVVIYASSNKVYGSLSQFQYEEKEKRYICKDHPNGFDENISLNFHSPYGCSKGTADQYMLDYARIFGLKTIVFRHSSMYGGRQFATYDQGWISWFCQKAIEIKKGILKEPFTISGDGKQVRDNLYISDVVDLYFEASENIEKLKGQVFNIGGGIQNSLSLLELFDFLEKELKVRISYTKLPWRISDQKFFVAKMDKIKSLIGWQPKISQNEGIERLLTWLLKDNDIKL